MADPVQIPAISLGLRLSEADAEGLKLEEELRLKLVEDLGSRRNLLRSYWGS
jgi:hypothetical protein